MNGGRYDSGTGSVMANFFCVDSPFVEHCHIEAVERVANGVRSRVTLRPELMNSWGGAHGGLVAALLDASMTVAARYAVDPDGQQAVATVDLSVTFIGPGKVEIDCEAKVTGRNGAMIFLEAQARSLEGGLVARAVATSRIIGSKK